MFDNFTSDLTESLKMYYERFVDFLPKLAIAIIVLIAFVMVARWLRRFSNRKLVARMEDDLLADFLSRVIYTVLLIIGISMALSAVNLTGVASGLVAGAGISAFVIGFAFRDIGENLLAGIMMAFNRPFRISDTVLTNGVEGEVLSMSLRSTRIKTFEGRDVFVPNANILKNPFTNFTLDGFYRKTFTTKVPAIIPPEQAISLIESTVDDLDFTLEDKLRRAQAVIKDYQAGTFDVHYWINTFKHDDPTYPLHNNVVIAVEQRIAQEVSRRQSQSQS